MPRLHRVSCTSPGIVRVRQGDRFTYRAPDGREVDDASILARIEALVLPPAWEDVWICRVASGHIQATGVDARGRRQYRYHDAWRLMRDLSKHERVLDFAAALPAAREAVARDLAEPGLGRRKVLSCAVRLLDLGFFRVGSEQYAEQNGTFGLATIRKEHVTVSRGGVVTFDYTAKSGKHRVQSVVDDDVLEVVGALRRRRGGGDELLAWREGPTRTGTWVDVRSGDVNQHLREVLGGEWTAKDFRTWNATVLCAVGLAVSVDAAPTATARRRAVTRVVQEVATYLGNTPAVCRASYVDPRIIDLYEHGVTVAPALHALGEDGVYGRPATQGALEAAVLSLLRAPVEQALAG